MSRKNRNVVKYRRPIRLNVGTVIFLFIFIYLVIIVFSYFSSNRSSVYEVVQKHIADNNTCQGIILRKEKVQTSSTAGYISFYVKDGDRVSRKANVYSVDESGKIYDTLVANEADQKLASEDNTKVRNYLKAFQKSFRYSDYSTVTDLRCNIDKIILDFSHLALSDAMQKLVKNSGETSSFQLVSSKTSGIFSSTIDGFESLKEEDISKKTFEKKAENRTVSYDTALTEGTPVYKLITNESWSIVLNLSKEQYKKLAEKEENAKGTPMVTIRFVKDGFKQTVPFKTFTKGDGYFATLFLQKYMISYLNERFIDVELILNSAEGLKIPKTALLEKEFYKVPIDYFTTAGENNASGLVKKVYRQSGDVKYEFVETGLVAKVDEDYAYIEKSGFDSGIIIQNPKTQEEYTIGETGTLKGVYNVNKGYCIFKQVEILYENDEYCIVSDKTYNGLSNYDHILLNSENASEEEIIK
ncbi:HlyD family efflux transporter periplasmic adaptor subunit [[Clostridium] polysaccharolyticum]|uniref:RND related barrel-sandwich hybrid domain-containing protein n=1 Tax=[Clostridium] polysaccharolyticum TaxID=29364 RepID=A0A1I0E1V9_9FIRM|nr:HlyD family efflux transporter periplasmic adaptor subunit [[Clostridium] polysaccharolyticum]SET38941.1 hypothetical protein SAMN04487772_11814 [[Clostridium] polysaccharolyticum]